MGIKLVVAITDSDWYEFLRYRRDLTEVNFWAPGGGVQFRALQRGELLLFKLHAPRNFIVGYGIFAHPSILPCSLAWESFGEANGAGSFSEMRRRIARYRHVSADTREDFAIGCRILTQPVFFDESGWIPVPTSWSPQTQRFKTFDATAGDGLRLWEAIQDAGTSKGLEPGLTESPARYGAPTLIQPRLGQGGFRVMVTDNYHRRCAVTGERTLPALDAAHIRPYSEGGGHSPRNGLLLRKDIHSIFDAGYATVTPDLRFEVSCKIKEDFENGRDYYALHGRGLIPPPTRDAWPDPSLLKWHNEVVYRG